MGENTADINYEDYEGRGEEFAFHIQKHINGRFNWKAWLQMIYGLFVIKKKLLSKIITNIHQGPDLLL